MAIKMVPSCLLTSVLFILVKSVLHHRRMLTEDARIDLSGIFFAMDCFGLGWVLGFFLLFFSFIFSFDSNRISPPHDISPPNYHFLNVDISSKG